MAPQLQLRFRSDGYRQEAGGGGDAGGGGAMIEGTGFKAHYQFLPARKQFQGDEPTFDTEEPRYKASANKGVPPLMI